MGDDDIAAAARLHAALAPHATPSLAAALVAHAPSLGASAEAAAAAGDRRARLARILPTFLSLYDPRVAAVLLAGGPHLVERLVAFRPPDGAPSPATVAYLAEPARRLKPGDFVGDTTVREVEQPGGALGRPNTRLWKALRREGLLHKDELSTDDDDDDDDTDDENALDGKASGNGAGGAGGETLEQRRAAWAERMAPGDAMGGGISSESEEEEEQGSSQRKKSGTAAGKPRRPPPRAPRGSPPLKLSKGKPKPKRRHKKKSSVNKG